MLPSGRKLQCLCIVGPGCAPQAHAAHARPEAGAEAAGGWRAARRRDGDSRQGNVARDVIRPEQKAARTPTKLTRGPHHAHLWWHEKRSIKVSAHEPSALRGCQLAGGEVGVMAGQSPPSTASASISRHLQATQSHSTAVGTLR